MLLRFFLFGIFAFTFSVSVLAQPNLHQLSPKSKRQADKEIIPGIKWEKTYGDSILTSKFGYERPNKMIRTKDGGFLLIGTISVDGNFADEHPLIIKVNGEGSPQWQLSDFRKDLMGRSIMKSDGEADEFYVAIPNIADGIETQNGYVLVGKIGDRSDGWMAKVSMDGKLLWQKHYDGREDPYEDKKGDDGFAVICPASNGRFIVAGETEKERRPAFSGGSWEYYGGWIIEVDSEGSIGWRTSIWDSTSCTLNRISASFNRGFSVTGQTYLGEQGLESNFWLANLDSNGHITSKLNLYQGNSFGKLYIAYDAYYFVDDDFDVTLTKLDSSGNIKSKRALFPGQCGHCAAFSQYSDSSYILTGSIAPDKYKTTPKHPWLLKMRSDGSTIWFRTLEQNSEGKCLIGAGPDIYSLFGEVEAHEILESMSDQRVWLLAEFNDNLKKDLFFPNHEATVKTVAQSENLSSPSTNRLKRILTPEVIQNLASHFTDRDEYEEHVRNMCVYLGIVNTYHPEALWLDAMLGHNEEFKNSIEQWFRCYPKFNNIQLDFLSRELGLSYDESKALQGK